MKKLSLYISLFLLPFYLMASVEDDVNAVKNAKNASTALVETCYKLIGEKDSFLLERCKFQTRLDNNHSSYWKLLELEVELSIYNLSKANMLAEEMSSLKLPKEVDQALAINRVKLLRYRGLWDEAKSNLDNISLEEAETYFEHRNALQYHIQSALIAFKQERLRDALIALEKGRQGLENVQNKDRFDFYRTSLYIQEILNNDDEALFLGKEALAIAQEENYEISPLHVKFILGNLLLKQDKTDKAIEYYHSIYHQKHKPFFHIELLNNLGVAFNNLGLTDSAEFYYRKVIPEKSPYYTDIMALINIGNIKRNEGRLLEALSIYNQAEKKATENNYENGKAYCFMNKAKVFKEQNDLSKSNEYAQKALNQFAGKDDQLEHALVCHNLLYENYLALGDSPKALRSFQQYHIINDTLKTKKEARLLAQFEAKENLQSYILQTQEQQQEIERRKHQSNVRFLYYLISVLVLLAFIIILRIQFKKRKMKDDIEKERLTNQLKFQSQKFDVAKAEMTFNLQQTIAMELHDNILSALSGNRLISEQIAEGVGSADDHTKNLVKIQSDSLHTTYESLRKYVINLRQNLNPFIESNIMGDLKDFIDVTLQPHHINSVVNTKTNVKLTELSDEFQMQLSRMIKEILTNIIKYSNAKTVVTEIEIKDEVFCLSIFDNGVGIPVDKLHLTTGGIANIRKRVSSLDGKLDILTKEEEGTIYDIRLKIT